MKLKNNTLHLGFIALAVAGLSATQSVHAAAATWDGSVNSNWADTSGADTNFTGGAGTNGILASGDSLTFTDATGLGGTTLNNNLTSAGFNIAGITFNSASPAYVIGGSGTFTLTGGITNSSTSSLQTINNNIALSTAAHTFSAASGGMTLGGNLSGSTGNVTFTGAGTTTLGGTNTFTINNSGNFGAFLVGSGNGLSPTAGNVSITGATEVTASSGTHSGFIAIVGNSTLTIQSGGSLAINGVNNNGAGSFIGQNGAGTSTLRVNGGSLTVSGAQGFHLGNNRGDATGVLTIDSGTATINRGSTTTTDARSFITMGKDGATGTINLNGGTLATDRYFVDAGGSSTGNFVFGGGTLKALADQTNWLSSVDINSYLGALSSVTTTAVSTIDANGFSVAINNNISGAGGFTIDSSTGTGTVTFGGTNTYMGKTTVTDGTLALGAGGSIANSSEIALNGGNFNVTAVPGFTIGGSQSLTGNGSVTGDITVGGNLAIGNSPGRTMTFNDDLALVGGSTSDFQFTTASFALGSFDLALGGVGDQDVSFGGTLNLLFDSGETYTNGSSVQIFDFENYANNFGTVNFSGLGLGQSASFDSTTGFVTVIPEPKTALLGALGMLALLRRRRN